MSLSSVRPAEPPKAPSEKIAEAKSPSVNSELLRGVRVSLDVRLGQAAMAVEEMMALKTGSVVTLQAGLADHVDLYLNETLVARGEIVAVGDKYGVRIVEIAAAP